MSLTASQNSIITKTAKGQFYTSLMAGRPSIDVGQFTSTDSLTASSKDFGWFGAPPMPREWVGPRHHVALRDYTETLAPRKWELTMGVNRELIEDDQTMQAQLPRISAALSQNAQEHVVQRWTQVLEAGTGSTIDTAWDGQFYFDTDHSFGNSGTVDNDKTSAAATGTDPTAGEFETAFGDAIEAMHAFPDDQGNPSGHNGSFRFVAVIPPSYQKAAGLVLNPGGTFGPGAGGENQSTSATGLTAQFRGSQFDYVVNPWLTNADRFYVLRPGLPGAVGPFILQTHAKAPWEIELKEDLENDCYTFYLRARYEVHYGNFLASLVHVFT